MYEFYKTAAATPKIRVGNPRYNAEEICRIISAAAARGIKLLVLPKDCVCGVTCGDLKKSSALIRGVYDAVGNIADFTRGKDMLVIFGAPLVLGGAVCSCGIAVMDGKILGAENLCGVGSDIIDIGGRLFAAGCGNVFKCGDVSVEIADDCVGFGGGAAILAVLGGARLTVGGAKIRKNLLEAASYNRCGAVVYAGAGEGESSTDFSFAGERYISECGETLCAAPLYTCGENFLTVTDIDCGAIAYKRRLYCTEELCGDVVEEFSFADSSQQKEIKLDRIIGCAPFCYGGDPSAYEEALTIQAHALSTRIAAAGVKKLVIGISGGLDSSLALLVSVRAAKLSGMTIEDVIGVTMPCYGTGSESLNTARALMCALGITAKEIAIADGVTEALKSIGHGGAADITYENAQARYRTLTLFNIANACGGLVVGTGDMSELALGWCTYGGDQMSGYSVNGGVPKTLVKALVAYEAERLKGETAKILKKVLSADISPELTPIIDGKTAQKTEEILGDYILHDFFLYWTAARGADSDKVLYLAKAAFGTKYKAAEIKKRLKLFIDRFFKNQFKRTCAPDGVMVTEISLSPRCISFPTDADGELFGIE